MEQITNLFESIVPLAENWLRGVMREELERTLEADREKQRPPKMYSRQEVCDLLKISMPTLWSKTSAGEIQATHAGRRVLYAEDEIKRYLATH